MEFCSRLLLIFGRNFCEKRQIWVPKPHFGELVKSNARPWLMAHWSFFRYLFRFWGYEAKCVRLGCFLRERRLCTKVLPGQGRPPSTTRDIRKLEDTGLPDGEDRIPLCSLVLTQYRSVTDRRTDGRISVACTELAKLALRRAVKTMQLCNVYVMFSYRLTNDNSSNDTRSNPWNSWSYASEITSRAQQQ